MTYLLICRFLLSGISIYISISLEQKAESSPSCRGLAMNNSRRAFLCGAVSAAALGASLLRPTKAWANSGFEYDALGRLTKATLADGTTVLYTYDAAGNRTQVDSSGGPPPPPPPFNAIINVTGPAPINLRGLADAAGYTGAQPATITFNVAASTSIVGQPGAIHGGVAIDTGIWPTGTYAPALSLVVAGKVWGGGGAGAAGVRFTVQTPGNTGGNGGDALVCRTPIAITVSAGGEIKGGGGGGGSGSPRISTSPNLGARDYGSSNGAGGGFPNGSGGSGIAGSAGGSYPGSSGTAAGGGLPGALGTLAGASGNGGNAGTNGASGGSATYAGGAGGTAGYAIRKNGNSVPVTNNGTIAGSQG
jgi:YD repeat-containing protein